MSITYRYTPFKIIIHIGILIYLSYVFLFNPKSVAATCEITSLGNVSVINSVCSIDSFTTEGIDIASSENSTENTANLTITDAAITINTDASLIAGTVTLNGTSSISVLATRASIKTGPVWALDNDADGWPSSPLQLFDTPLSGRRRLGLMSSIATLDCNDESSSVTNSCCVVATRYIDADGDGYGNAAINISACPTSGYVNNGNDCDDSDPNTYPGTVYCP